MSRFHLVLQETLLWALPMSGQGQWIFSAVIFYFYLGSQTGAANVPSLAARQGKLYYMPGSSGPVNSPGKENKMLPALVFPSPQWKRVRFLHNEAGKPGAF